MTWLCMYWLQWVSILYELSLKTLCQSILYTQSHLYPFKQLLALIWLQTLSKSESIFQCITMQHYFGRLMQQKIDIGHWHIDLFTSESKKLGIFWNKSALVVDISTCSDLSKWLSMLTIKNQLPGFLFLCMHEVLFLQLWCSAWQLGALLL